MSTSKQQMLMVNSITYAYRARDFLYNKGIKCYIERIPSNLRVTGCGYGVRVINDGEAIAQMLNDAGIKVKDIITI